jgi:hypothetical protein
VTAGPNPAERAAGAQERIAAGLEELLRNQRIERRERDEKARRLDERIGHVSEPRTFNLLDACRVVNGLAGAWPTIPPEFWSLDTGIVTVSCPCGATPELHPSALGTPGVPVDCDGEGCERTYAYTGEAVRVFSPTTLAAVTDAA